MRIACILREKIILRLDSSLCALGGPSPLRVTEDAMQHLLKWYNIDTEFLHVLLSFGNAPLPSECGSSSLHRVITHDSIGK